jgi:MFS family permease
MYDFEVPLQESSGKEHKNKISIARLAGMSAYTLGLSFMWNSLHPIVLPAVLLHLVPLEAKNSYLGGLTFLGMLLAMFIQPISGAASDHWRSRWGRRRPLALLGTLLDFVFLGLLAWSKNIWVLLLGYVGLQITSNTAQGPLQALVPDRVPREQLGRASGVKNLLDMGGVIIASVAAGRLLSPQDRYPTTVMLVVMGVLGLSAAITLLSAREESSLDGKENRHIQIREVFRPDLHSNRNYAWLIGSRFVFLMGVYGVQAFAQYYIQDVMRAANPVKATGDLMTALALMLVVAAPLGGWLADKIGARCVVKLASLVSAAGCFLLLLAHDLDGLVLFAGVLGAGIGLYLSSNWALASRLAPKTQAGKFLGLTNLATAGASAFSRLLGFPVDWLNNARPGAYAGYSALFVLGGVGALLSLILLARVRED